MITLVALRYRAEIAKVVLGFVGQGMPCIGLEFLSRLACLQWDCVLIYV